MFVSNMRKLEAPFFLKHLQHSKRLHKVLDVGCYESSENVIPILLERGFEVWGIDVQGTIIQPHPNFHFVKGDFITQPYSRNFFDAISLLSTLEHIGVGWYKDPVYEDGDFLCMEKCRKILKKEGKLLLSFPFAVEYELLGERIYNEKRIRDLLKGFKVIEENFGINEKEGWRFSSKDEALKAEKAIIMICCIKRPVD